MRRSARLLPATVLGTLVLAALPAAAAVVAADGIDRSQSERQQVRFEVSPEQSTAGDLAPNLKIIDGAMLASYSVTGENLALPAAAVLLGSALVGLGGLAMRRRRPETDTASDRYRPETSNWSSAGPISLAKRRA